MSKAETAPPTMYAVASSDLLKLLMERTGTGEAVTSRELAEAVGIAHGTIGGLMSGAQRVVPEPKAKAIAAALGVDLLVLWVPMERAGRVFIPTQAAS
ncbi:helix-turn-helix domain-containing protein [Streptomyces scabiei]|uniref:helix-turn-helix domain-containing protein n=1 Tax=Streptomyces scabiei TaxID=1930 RepID=UPI00131BF74A|nr:helix-turn-helix transcriptional regulator [Streptomyces scabiei]MDX3679470.1 helix-turn-helix transcriptional regulator [Streptomyces scabiei]